MNAPYESKITSKPLAGRRILVTRATHQSSGLQRQLEAVGAAVVEIPAIAIAPPDSYAALDAALAGIAGFDWMVMTSANAVDAIAGRLQVLHLPASVLEALQIAVIGKATAHAVEALGVRVKLLPPVAVAESLAEALTPFADRKRFLLARAKVARDVLPKALKAAGASVTIVDAYQTFIPKNSAALLKLELKQPIAAVVFTSASSVENLIALAEAASVRIPPEIKKISIGPVTTRALIQHRWNADEQAAEASIDALVASVITACSPSQANKCPSSMG